MIVVVEVGVDVAVIEEMRVESVDESRKDDGEPKDESEGDEQGL